MFAGTVMVQAGPNQFSRGSTDTFIYPRLPFLGDLLQVSRLPQLNLQLQARHGASGEPLGPSGEPRGRYNENGLLAP